MLSSLLWYHPWLRAQDQLEELSATSVVHGHRLSEKPVTLEEAFWGERFGSFESSCSNCQCVLIDFRRPCGRLFMRMEKKISLMNCIWTFKLKRWSRDMLRSQQIYLPDGLFHQPKLCNVLRNSGFFSQFLHSWQSLQKAFRTIINPWKFSFHFIIVYRKRLAANLKAKVISPT